MPFPIASHFTGQKEDEGLGLASEWIKYWPPIAALSLPSMKHFRVLLYRSKEWLLKSRKGAFQLSLNSAQQVRTSLTMVCGPAAKTPTEARLQFSAAISVKILFTAGRPRLTGRRAPSSACPTCRQHPLVKIWTCHEFKGKIFTQCKSKSVRLRLTSHLYYSFEDLWLPSEYVVWSPYRSLFGLVSRVQFDPQVCGVSILTALDYSHCYL